MKKWIALIIVVLCVGGYLWYRGALKPVNEESTARILITIPEGSSVTAIADMLEDKGVIRSARAFKLYVRMHGRQSTIQAGSFPLQASLSTPEVIEALASGETEEISLTIPEGYTVKDIDALLVEKGISRPGEIQECARTCAFEEFPFLPTDSALADRGGRIEGYLYPDTYYVDTAQFTPERFLGRLISTFEARVVEGLKDDLRKSGRSLHSAITMASLVEEETRRDDERATVAGILWKRFDADMGLGVDAAVRYILDKPTATITARDLDIDSPYNLRKYRGLGPGPIANAGLASIKATLHPQETKYWYYLHGTDGQIRYAETNDEHNMNRARYL